MHHALEIQEILLIIFGHCRPSLPSRRRATPDLVALAGTCRVFKEPALDVLWEDLDDLSPLVRCLPGAFQELPAEAIQVYEDLFIGNKFLLSRLLTQTEWNILLGYTRRVRSVIEVRSRLDEESFRYLSLPRFSKPLLPNLRYLRCEYKESVMSLLGSLLPSLTSLDLVFDDTSKCKEFLESNPISPNPFPNINSICFRVRNPEGGLIRIERDFISSWRKIQSVVCPQITLNLDALSHLSRMPALTRLTFKQIVLLPASDTPLPFSNLRCLMLHSASLGPISRLLFLIRLPCVTDFAAIIDSCPSRQELSSLLFNLQTSNASHTLESLTLDQTVPSMAADRGPDSLVLDLEDLRPCMSFPRLRSLKLNIAWNVHLRDNDLLTLTSAWPHIQRLVINAYAGWNSQCGAGVTPPGLTLLLQTCRELRWIALALDTRGYATSSPPETSSLELGLEHRFGLERRLGLGRHRSSVPTPVLAIDVLDAVLDAETVPAVATYFAGIIPRAAKSDVSLCAWGGGKMVRPEGWEGYKMRWENAFRSAYCRLGFLSRSGSVLA